MIEQVNTLIYNTLCSNTSIFLPTVGTLVVRRNPATMASARRVNAPSVNVTFTAEQRADSLVNLIASTADITVERAEDIYNQWLQNVTSDGVVAISGVGVVKNRTFIVDKDLIATLNPQVTPVTLKPRRRALVWVLSLLVVAVMAVAAIVLIPKREIVTNTVAVVDEDQTIMQSMDTTSVEIIEPIVESVVADDVFTMTDGWSYVVWGVYSQKENALKYKELVENRYGDVICTIYYYKNNLYMVSLYQSATRGEAIRRVEELKTRHIFFDEIWIFTNK